MWSTRVLFSFCSPLRLARFLSLSLQALRRGRAGREDPRDRHHVRHGDNAARRRRGVQHARPPLPREVVGEAAVLHRGDDAVQHPDRESHRRREAPMAARGKSVGRPKVRCLEAGVLFAESGKIFTIILREVMIL